MTAEFATLHSIGSPYLLRTAIDRNELACEFERLKAASAFATCILSGCEMKTVSGVFKEFARGLAFPEYFGFNGAAFDECLNDLSWLDAAGICIGIANAARLLEDERSEIAWLLSALDDAGEEWSTRIEGDEAWQTEAIPFHVIFHVETGSTGHLPPEILALPSLE